MDSDNNNSQGRGGFKGGYGGRGGFRGRDESGESGGFNGRDGYRGRSGYGGRGGYQGRGGYGGRSGYGGRDYYSNPNFGQSSYPHQNRYPRQYESYYPSHDNLNEEQDQDYLEKKEKMGEERNFKKKYNIFIDKILSIFFQINEEDATNIVKTLIQMPFLTIFEAMNLIYRHAIIYYSLNYYISKDDKTICLDGDIFENKYPNEFPSDQSNKIIETYKIKKNDENNDIIENKEYLYEDENIDKRRRITKNKDDIYNYLPILESDKIYINEEFKNKYKELEIFAKNENEINYHPLFFKTMMCHSCSNIEEDYLCAPLCPNSHDIQTDFKILYDYKDKNICELMNDLNNSNLFHFESYLKYIPKNINFDQINLHSFKVHKCILDKSCPNDYHLCPFYHHSLKDKDSQRRPPLLFRYCSEICEYCFDKNKKKYIVKNCPYGIFCNYIHNKNEYNYHFHHFRKIYKCTRNANGKCPFIKTCYGIHKDSEYDAKSEEENEENEDDVDDEDISDDEEIKATKEKIKNMVEISKYFRCRICNSLKNVLCFFKDCKHFICFNCFKNIYYDLKKINKNEKKENQVILKCPFCYNDLEKEKLIKCDFLKQ